MVSDALRYSDLPASPGIISLYLLGLPTVTDHTFSSLTFLSLLEHIEALRLAESPTSEFDTIYHRRIILEQVAVRCHQDSAIHISELEFLQIITDHYQQGGLRVRPREIVQALCTTGIVNSSASGISFTHFVYFDYFLAKAFAENRLTGSDSFDGIPKLVQVAQALSLFAGLRRENEDLVDKVLSVIQSELPHPIPRDLRELDKHIQALVDRKGAADEIMTDDLNSSVDTDEADAEYESDRIADRDRRNNFLNVNIAQSIDEISKRAEGLRAFYTIFRNLERIPLAKKIELLDRILDYHIDTNFHLIEFYYRSRGDDALKAFLAYVVTLTGQDFLAAFLGSSGIVQAVIDNIGNAQNDLKQMLMILLLSDLRVKEAYALMSEFLKRTESFSAIQICYAHLRRRLIKSDDDSISNEEKALFRLAHSRKEEKSFRHSSQGQAKDSFERVFREVEKARWVQRNMDREVSE